MKQSAALLLYRQKNEQTEVLLVHPGGPFWKNKDNKAWSIPKGEFNEEDILAAAKREFEEELGKTAPEGNYLDLGSVKQLGGKQIFTFATESDFDHRNIKSNNFEIEWPPKSGRKEYFPEVDKAQWFELKTAAQKLHPGQAEFLARLAEKMGFNFDPNIDESASGLTDKQVSLL